MTTKLPTDTRPLVRDPDLAKAIDKLLQPYSGEKLTKAQNAVREVRASAAQGRFDELLEAYRVAIQKAVK